MAKSLSIAFFALVLLVKTTSSQFPCQVNPVPYSGPTIPSIPDTFSMDVINTAMRLDGTILYKNVNHLYVDAGRKLAVEVQGGDYNNGGKRTIYDGNRKQAMVIQGRTCNVQSFSDVIMDADSVYNPTLFTTGNEFFRFGAGFSPKFFGNSSYMSAMASVWQECIPSLGGDEMVNVSVMYFFNKNSQNGMKFLGYRAQAIANSSVFSEAQNIVVGNPFPDMLKVPSDIFCNMSQTSYQMPKMPDEFEMNVEFLMHRNKSGYNARDYVDTKEKYFRSDHHHKEKKTGKIVPVHEIHDFNTGLSYTINSRTFDCEMAPLTNGSWDVTETEDHHHIRMRTTEEFFGRDHTDFVYEGVTTVRGIPVDVFSAIRPSRRHPKEMVIRKWHYSTPDWKIGGVEGPLNDTRVPIMLKFIGNGSIVTANLFNFDPIEPTNHILWPLRQCYKNNRHYMYFRLHGQFDKLGVTNQRGLTNALRDSLSKAGKISKLRVSSILTFKSSYGGVVAVRVYVLGLPRINGTVKVLHPIHQTPLKNAVDGIRTSIKTGKFSVSFQRNIGGQREVVTMSAVKDSYFDYSADPEPTNPKPEKPEGTKSGLSGGAVTGIVFAMVALAVVITIVVLQFVLNRRGVSLFGYSRHKNEATA